MIATTVHVDALRALRALDRITVVGGAVQVGTSRGLNEVAFLAMRHERGDMGRRLDRPSRFTVSGTQVIRAKPGADEIAAIVHVEDKRAKYLAAQEFGGSETRGSIGASRGSGSDAIVIPVAEAMKNQFGSAGRNAVKRALRLPHTFVAKLNPAMPGGVWQRRPGAARHTLLLSFADKVDFKPKLHFGDDVTAFALPRVRRAVGRAVDRELSRAVRS